MADKIRHNNSITNGDFGFSGGFITAISGYPIAGAGGGGGGGGNVYCGDNEYIQYKYGTSNTFTVTEKVKDVVDNLTDKVALQIDAQTYNKEYIDTNLSAKQDVLVFAGNGNNIETINGSAFKVTGYVPINTYQIDKNNYNNKIDSLSASVSGKQDKLIFEYDEDNKVSAINGSALSDTTYTPGQYINIDSNNEISVTGLVSIDEYATYSGDWNEVSNSYKTYSGDFLTSEDLTSYSTIEHADNASANAFNQATAQIPDVSNFITKDVDDLTNYYTNTQTSSESELAEAFGSILKYDVTAAAGIEITTATDAGVKTFGISISAEPVVTDTRLSGYSGVAAEPDGNVSGLWNVGLTQDMLSTINGKLDITAASQTYQTKGDYVSSTDIGLDANNKVTAISGKELIITAHQSLDDYATKVYANNASANALSEAKTWVENQHYLSAVPDEYITETELAGYNYVTTATTNSLSSQIEDISSTLNDKYTLSGGSGIYFYEDVLNKITRIDCTVTAATTVAQLTDSANYYKKEETSGANEISAALNNKANNSDLDDYLTLSQYETDSATFATETELETVSGEIVALIPTNYVTSGDYISGSKQYALTSAGWAEVQAGGLSIPINIGSNNALNIPTAESGTWGDNADGYLVIGNNSKVGKQSYVFGNDSIAQKNSTVLNGGNSALHDSIAQGWLNIAIERSQAFGYNSSANYNSFAAGYAVAATNYSFAGGQAYDGARGNILANDHSFALGVGSNAEPVYANNYSFSFGYATSAQHYAFAFGKSIDVEGSDGHAVIGVGGYNEKVQNAAIIVGNGTNNARNNSFVVYNDGNVSAKQYKAEGYTDSNSNYVEASVPKSLPNSGDNAMVVQKMFVCTSDNDIIAHSNLANGEGCIFFRVG